MISRAPQLKKGIPSNWRKPEGGAHNQKRLGDTNVDTCLRDCCGPDVIVNQQLNIGNLRQLLSSKLIKRQDQEGIIGIFWTYRMRPTLPNGRTNAGTKTTSCDGRITSLATKRCSDPQTSFVLNKVDPSTKSTSGSVFGIAELVIDAVQAAQPAPRPDKDPDSTSRPKG